MTVATVEYQGVPKFGLWAGRVMSGAVAGFLLADAAPKLLDLRLAREAMGQLGYPPTLDRPLGLLELMVLALYLVPRASTFGALLLTGLLGGAISAHLRVGDPLLSHALSGIYLGVLAWSGLYLRRPGLQSAFAWRAPV
jgi:hypothetical protein